MHRESRWTPLSFSLFMGIFYLFEISPSIFLLKLSSAFAFSKWLSLKNWQIEGMIQQMGEENTQLKIKLSKIPSGTASMSIGSFVEAPKPSQRKSSSISKTSEPKKTETRSSKDEGKAKERASVVSKTVIKPAMTEASKSKLNEQKTTIKKLSNIASKVMSNVAEEEPERKASMEEGNQEKLN